MKKFSAVEWQSFSLKKDVEKIIKKLGDNHAIQLSLLGEIAVIFLGAALPNIFADIAEQRCFWIIMTALSIMPIFVLAFRWIRKKHKENQPGSDRMAPRDFIDAFDNEISYYVLMSESYFTMLNEALGHVDEVNIEITRFFYIEASYYFKKAIADLAPIAKIADKVISSDVDLIAEQRLITLARYDNVKNLLFVIYDYLEKHKVILDDFDSGNTIYKLNKKFRDNLKSIDFAVSQTILLE